MSGVPFPYSPPRLPIRPPTPRIPGWPGAGAGCFVLSAALFVRCWLLVLAVHPASGAVLFLLAMCRQTGRCCSPGSLLHIVASNATLLTLRLLVQMPQTPNRFQRGYICVNEKGKQGIAGPFYKLASNARMANNCHFAACWEASQTL